MFKKCLMGLLVLCMMFGSSSIAFAKNDFADKKPGSYFTGSYYISESEIVVTNCNQLFLGKGTIIRASNIAFLTYPKSDGKITPKYTTIFSSDKNDIIVVLDEDMQVYLTDGGYVCTVFDDVDEYLSTLKNRCDITPKAVVLMDNQKSQFIQMIRPILF